MNVNFVFSDVLGQAGELWKIAIFIIIALAFLHRHFWMRKKYKFSRMKDIQARWDSMSGDNLARKQEFCKDRFGRFFNKNEYMFFQKMDNDPSILESYTKYSSWFKVEDNLQLRFDKGYILYYLSIVFLCIVSYFCYLSLSVLPSLLIVTFKYHPTTVREFVIIIFSWGVTLVSVFSYFVMCNALGIYHHKILGFWNEVPDEHKQQNSRPFDLYDGLRFIRKKLLYRFPRGLVRR